MQYQLQYNNEGTASLKEMDAIPTRKVSEGTFEVSDYFAPRIDYGITETYADTFSPEKQLELIQKKLLGKDSGNDKDDSTYKKNLSPEFDWKTYTYNEYVKALGEDAANDYLKYSKLEDYAKVANWATLVFPVNYLAKAGLKGTGKFATSKKEAITKQYLNSDYYTNKMNAMDLDYKTYGDYDSYSDVYSGPSYGKEITQGTIYDAEDPADDWDPSKDGIMSKPKTVTKTVTQPVRHHSQNGGGNAGPTGHGDASRAGGESTSTAGSF